MISALTINYMCNNRFFRQKVPVNADSRSSSIFIVGKKNPK